MAAGVLVAMSGRPANARRPVSSPFPPTKTLQGEATAGVFAGRGIVVPLLD